MMPPVTAMPSSSRSGPSTVARRLAGAAGAALLVALAGCGSPPPAPPPPPPASAFTANDAQDCAHLLAQGALAHPWLVAYKARANRAPVLTIGELQDHTGDHVDVAELARDLAANLSASSQLTVVGADVASQADFQLNGSISMDAIPGGRRYTIDLRLTGRDGDTVWVGGLEREVKTPAPDAAPAAPAPTAHP
jgi:hypothetical protein